MDIDVLRLSITACAISAPAPDGNVRITVDVAARDAHCAPPAYSLVRGLVNGTAIKAYSGILTDPPLPDGAMRPVLRGDATAGDPSSWATARELLATCALTAQDSALAATAANAQALTERPLEALGLLMGNERDARKVLGYAGAHQRVAGAPDGMAAGRHPGVWRAGPAARGTGWPWRNWAACCRTTRASLRKVDAVLAEAPGRGAPTCAPPAPTWRAARRGRTTCARSTRC